MLFAITATAQTQEDLDTTRKMKLEQLKANEGGDWIIRWKGETAVPRVLSNGLSKSIKVIQSR